MTSSAPVVQVRDLHKTYRIGFLRRRVEAIRGIDFEVGRGSFFGLLGPNGAGKTTTIKMLLRLIFPTRGQIRIFGRPVGPRVMHRVGYMPENPYVYQYLRPLEFLDLCGRLANMPAPTRRKRAAQLVEKVGLAHALDRPVGRFSKGMMQRVGLAQALLHDPELLVLDEPLSGLDPIGRKEIRDVLLEQRAQGKTVLFTSHVLSDVEMLCDHVAIINRGKVSSQGPLRDLLRPEVRRAEIELGQVSDTLRAQLEEIAREIREEEEQLVAVVEGQAQATEAARIATEAGAIVYSVTPQRETLEDLFLRDAV